MYSTRNLILVVVLALSILPNHANFTDADDEENELLDFDFENQNPTENEIPQLNSIFNTIKEKEKQIQNAITNAMKDPNTQRNFAQVLPILKYMTPAQKLALAALVKKQVLDSKKVGYDLQEVNNVFAGNNKNISRDLLLPISLDIANLFRKPRHIESNDIPQSQALRVDPGPLIRIKVNDKPIDDEENQITTVKAMNQTKVEESTEQEEEDEEEDEEVEDQLAQESTTELEQVPEAQELRGGPNMRLKVPFRRNSILPPPGKFNRLRKPIKKPPPNFDVRDNHCDSDINGICWETNDYPMDKIMIAIHRNRDAMHHMFAEFNEYNSTYLENNIDDDNIDDYNNRRVSHDDNDENKGLMCSSMVKFIRPKKAKATSGKWKFVVNTKEHSQTLRIEKCLNPHGSCSYLNDNYRSQCMQIYNYHRLLTWDNKIGLHMDIFKVPTCCSCHIEGYRPVYPPDPVYPVANLQPESFPGHEIVSQGSGPDAYGDDTIDPNLVISESQFDATLNFGEPKYPNRKHQQPVGSSSNKNFGVIRNKNKKQFSSTTNYRTSSVEEPDFGSSNSGLSHYLEAPKAADYASSYLPQRPTTQRPKRVSNRRPPGNNNRQLFDLDFQASSHQTYQSQYLKPTSTQAPTTSEHYYNNIIERTTPEPRYHRNGITKRVNYNYHPIIDFFEPASNHKNEPLTGTTHVAQKRSDLTSTIMHDDNNGWRPVTSPVLVNRRLAIGV